MERRMVQVSCWLRYPKMPTRGKKRRADSPHVSSDTEVNTEKIKELSNKANMPLTNLHVFYQKALMDLKIATDHRYIDLAVEEGEKIHLEKENLEEGEGAQAMIGGREVGVGAGKEVVAAILLDSVV
jgi:hypothetical protein